MLRPFPWMLIKSEAREEFDMGIDDKSGDDGENDSCTGRELHGTV
jgi:hypothetical protein